MENETNKQEFQQPTPAKRGFWLAGYIVAGLILAFSQSFKKTATDEFIILVIAIAAGFLYHRLKLKIKLKSEILKVIITFMILSIAAAFLIGFLTAIVNRF